jgi:trehalose-phosphatase
VAVLSGRSLSDLSSRVPLSAILAGNHGLEIEGDRIRYTHPDADSRKELVASASERIAEHLTAWPESWVERKGLTSTVHFRNVAARDRHEVMLAVRRAAGPFGTELRLRAGHCSLELRPRLDWHKGDAIRLILEHLGLQPSACFCLGDDATDETMFRSMPEAVTVRVGQAARTAAQYCLPDAAPLGETLSFLADLLVGEDTHWAAAAANGPL